MNGEWQAGVATIRKNGVDSADCSFMKSTACLFYTTCKITMNNIFNWAQSGA